MEENVIYSFKVLSYTGKLEPWTGSFKKKEDALIWYEKHGKGFESDGRMLIFCKFGKPIKNELNNSQEDNFEKALQFCKENYYKKLLNRLLVIDNGYIEMNNLMKKKKLSEHSDELFKEVITGLSNKIVRMFDKRIKQIMKIN